MEESNILENLNVISQKTTSGRRKLSLNEQSSSESVESGDDADDHTDDQSLDRLEYREEKTQDPVELVDNKPDYKQFLRGIRSISSQTNLRLNRRRNSTNQGTEHKFVSKYGDVKFYPHYTTIFDSDNLKNSDFFGIYVSFWFATSFLIFNNLVHFYMDGEKTIFETAVFHTMKKDIVKVAFSDLGMYLSSYFAYIVQYLCAKGYIRWHRTGWWVQGTYDLFFLLFWVWFSSKKVMSYPWIAKIFIMLHSCVFLMKMHSYGFYNGYLWNILEEWKFSKDYLQRLEKDTGILPYGSKREEVQKLLKESIKFCKFELEYQSGATSLSSSYNPEVDMKGEINDFEKEGVILFPHNITLKNYFQYTMFPTVVYTIKYPRTPRIRWKYVFEKTLAVFGIIFLMATIAENWIYPLVIKCQELREVAFPDKIKQFGFIFVDIVPPFLLIYILTFFLIWDNILNAIAELSRFADRDFYGPWWNCTDWSEYSRIWNIPVHKFLLRHVHHSSISTFKLNRLQASLVTFMLSSLLHELAMFVIFGTLRGYLLMLQMSQIPLVMLSHTKFMSDKKTLGITICWFGFLTGPSLLCMLYLTF